MLSTKKHSSHTAQSPAAFTQSSSIFDVLSFVLPLMIGLLSTAINSFADTLFVGKLGTAELAAVPFAAQVYTTGWIMMMGIVYSSMAFMARAYGAGKLLEMGEYLMQYHWLVLVGLPFMLLFGEIWPLFVTIARLSPEVAGYAWDYLHIRLWEAPLSLMLMLYFAFYQAQGRNWLPLYAALLVMISNILLDYLLIFGHWGLPALGVSGGAWATLIAQGLGMLLLVSIAFNSSLRHCCRLRFLVWPDWHKQKIMLLIGIPQGLGESIELLGWVALLMIIGHMGNTALAASNIGMQVSQLLFLPGFALGMAAASYVGRFIGMQRVELASRAVWQVTLTGILYMGGCGLSFWFFGTDIAALFTNDPAVIEQAVIIFRIIALFQIFDAVAIILRMALNGAGDTMVPTVIMMGCMLLVMLPGAYWLSQWTVPSVMGAWLGALIYTLLLSSLMFTRYKKGRWQYISLNTQAH